MDGQLSFGDELRGSDALLVAGEVAELLRMTPAWVYAETRANRLPHVRLGRYVRYRRAPILGPLEAEEGRIAPGRRGGGRRATRLRHGPALCQARRLVRALAHQRR